MQTGSLGDIVFLASSSRVLTPRTFGRESGASYHEHAVQGAAPRLEYLAPQLDSFDLSVTLMDILGVDPAAEAERVRTLCKDGAVLRLIIAGQNCGQVVIESVSEQWRAMAADGTVSRVDLSLTLKEYL